MAKRQRRRQRANTEQFKGNGADEAAVEAVSRSAAATIGHNSGGISDDELKAQLAKIKEAKAEVDVAQKVLDKAKGVLRQTYKVAKDKGAPTDDIRLYLAAKKLSTAEVVQSHRNMARIARIEGDPLYTQYDLWKSAEAHGEEAAKPGSGMDAELQGQHAYSNNEPLANNPFTQGTEGYVDWEQGWKNAEKATAERMRPTRPNGGAEAKAS